MPSRAGPLRSLPWPGVENCHCEEASSKRGHSASPRPRLVPCACPAPTASPAASGSSYRSASDGVRQRPAAAAAEARASGSCTAASSRVRPRSTASRALAAPVKFREVILGLGAPVVASWHLLDHARRGSAGEPRSWQSRTIGVLPASDRVGLLPPHQNSGLYRRQHTRKRSPNLQSASQHLRAKKSARKTVTDSLRAFCG